MKPEPRYSSLVDAAGAFTVSAIYVSAAEGRPFIPQGPAWLCYAVGTAWAIITVLRLVRWLRAPKVGNSEGAGR